MNAPITVAIPVGPNPHNRRWLDECIGSVYEQTLQPAEILLVDNGANLPERSSERVYRLPCNMGIPGAYNTCMTVATHPLVFLLGSDDMLLPTCLEQAYAAYLRIRDDQAMYWTGVRYSDGRPDQYEPWCGALMTKGLWVLSGGMRPETAVGAVDMLFISCLMAARGERGRIYPINTREPLYWYRAHPETETLRKGEWWGAIDRVHELLLAELGIEAHL